MWTCGAIIELLTKCRSYSQWLDFFQKLDYIIYKMNEVRTRDLVQGARVKHVDNPNKVGTVLQDLQPKAPIFGQVRVNWDDNNTTTKMHKFTLKVVKTNWLL